jgi:hypothetical protein
MLVQPVGILSIAPVRWPATGLHKRNAIWFGAQHPQKSFRVHRACSNFHIIGLLQYTILFGPELRQRQNQILKIQAHILLLKFYFNFQLFSKSCRVASFRSV